MAGFPLNGDLESQPVPADVQQGMRSPKVTLLVAGEQVCRVGSSLVPFTHEEKGKKRTSYSAKLRASNDDDLCASGWWYRERDFARMEASWKASQLSPGLSARFSAAVCQGWGSRMDVVVRALVLNSVKCWCGAGKTQRETAPNGIKIAWQPDASVEQLFIPGVAHARGGRTTMGYTTLNLVSAEPMDSGQLWDVEPEVKVPFLRPQHAKH